MSFHKRDLHTYMAVYPCVFFDVGQVNSSHQMTCYILDTRSHAVSHQCVRAHARQARSAIQHEVHVSLYMIGRNEIE